MAQPLLQIFDDGGTLIPEGSPISFAGVVPGSPSAEVLFSVRNNGEAGPAVDTARDTTVRGLARAAGDTSDPQLTGLPFQDDRASRLRVISVSGGATAAPTAFRPLGAGNVLLLDEIPDGGIVFMGWRIEATTVAALQDIDARLSIEPRVSIAMPTGHYETHGNFVLVGSPGGIPDPTFSEIFEEVGDWLPNVGPADDTINTPTRSEYTLAGVEEVFEPAPPEITFDDLDGTSSALVATEAYFAAVLYAAGGSISIAKGLKATEPLTAADLPVIPADAIFRVLVTVPFGLLIDTLELQGDLGFFHSSEPGGLDVEISGGSGTSAGSLVQRQTRTTITLPDDEVSNIWQLPTGGLETAALGAFPTGDSRSLILHEYTTAVGVITDRADRRRLGAESLGGVLASATFVLDTAAGNLQTLHITLLDGIGLPLSSNQAIFCKLTDAADGFGESTKIPDAVTVGASPQWIIQLGATINHFLLESDGPAIDATFDENTGPTGDSYFLALYVEGRVVAVSPEIIPKP